MQGADPLAPGSLLTGRYRIGQLLGAGGMSSVHRATDEALGREVAVKCLARGSADPAEADRVRSEIDLLATLSHRSLVTLFDAGTAELDGHAVTYLVMELIDGPTLAARSAQGVIAAEDIARMAQDLAEALVVVHAHGVVHRDIKPANVLLSPSLLPSREFDAKLADFGIASLVDGTRLTATGTVLGTAAYLSPEQAAGERVGPSSDVYSLGLVLLETITRRREYPGPLMESLSARQMRDPVVPGSIGYRWKSLLTAMTARDPDARPTAAEVLERLTEATGGLAVPVLPRHDPDAATAALAASAPSAGALPVDIAAATAAATAAAARGPADDAPVLTTAVLPAASAPPAADRRRRRWALIGGATGAALAALLIVLVSVAVQGMPTTTATTEAPSVAETPSESAVPETVETTPAPAAPAPAPAPAVEQPAGDQGGAGNQGGGEQGGGSGGAGSGNQGSDSDSNSGNGGEGGGSGGSGGGNGGGNQGGGNG